jgi:NhaP-type Na+/H+ or K+/H+ antiporter
VGADRLRTIGQLLMILGVAVGGAVGLALLFHLSIPGVPWLLAVGLAKLTLAGSAGLLGAGAFMQRLANRHDEQPALPSEKPH